MNNLTKAELEKVQVYADWLKGEGSNIKWDGEGDGSIFNPSIYEFENRDTWFIIYNGNCRGQMRFCFKYGASSETHKQTNCTKYHDCLRYNHLNYFKPIAESMYRKWKLKQICGDLFEC